MQGYEERLGPMKEHVDCKCQEHLYAMAQEYEDVIIALIARMRSMETKGTDEKPSISESDGVEPCSLEHVHFRVEGLCGSGLACDVPPIYLTRTRGDGGRGTKEKDGLMVIMCSFFSTNTAGSIQEEVFFFLCARTFIFNASFIMSLCRLADCGRGVGRLLSGI